MTSVGDQHDSVGDISTFPLSDKDKEVLALTDEEYQPHTFENLRELTGANALHLLTRYPTQLRRYIAWTAQTKIKWGTMNNYILHNRLHWTLLPTDSDPPLVAFALANSTPLTDPEDYRILPNDWPYGLALGLTHLVVWLKHKLDVDNGMGDLTNDSRRLVKEFVAKTFGEERVVWWRNWTALQSVRGLDHVHIVVKGMTKKEVFELTGEDGNVIGKAPDVASQRAG